jgi:glycosyltransferase involved in cell wall biosynthesis
VHVVPHVDQALPYFALCDVFAMVSREDPYPLVCLEAASLGKPILCFDGAGGEKEFVEEDCGFVVPYIDVEAMAAKAEILLASPDLRRRLGEAAKRKVRERHDLSVAAPKMLAVIEGLLRAGGGPSSPQGRVRA